MQSHRKNRPSVINQLLRPVSSKKSCFSSFLLFLSESLTQSTFQWHQWIPCWVQVPRTLRRCDGCTSQKFFCVSLLLLHEQTNSLNGEVDQSRGRMFPPDFQKDSLQMGGNLHAVCCGASRINRWASFNGLCCLAGQKTWRKWLLWTMLCNPILDRICPWELQLIQHHLLYWETSLSQRPNHPKVHLVQIYCPTWT